MATRRALLALLAVLPPLACANKNASPDAARALDGGNPDYLRPTADRYVNPGVMVTGTVRAPDGKMPVSGALVYATTKQPPAIPDGVYCDKCVELTKGTPNATSGPGGKFELSLTPGSWVLVTQKGAFRRVRSIEVPAGGMALAEELTTLPAATNPTLGDTIPKMAVVRGNWDAIENSLAKLGLGKVDGNGALVAGSESFVLDECKLISIFPPVSECKPVDPCELVKKPEELFKYNIVFVPCAGDFLNSCFESPTMQQTIKDWVKAGGRLYVTDYQYDLINVVFPGYVHWVGESSTLDSAEQTGSYDTQAVVNDPDLKAWLTAQGLTDFELLESWTIIDNIAKQPTPGPDDKPGQLFNTGPYTWMSGNVPGYGVKPMTVTFPYGCGKVLFSTYHTEGSKSSVEPLPQERALLYVILEVAVCMKDPALQ
jgi:hypothetical protein